MTPSGTTATVNQFLDLSLQQRLSFYILGGWDAVTDLLLLDFIWLRDVQWATAET